MTQNQLEPQQLSLFPEMETNLSVAFASVAALANDEKPRMIGGMWVVPHLAKDVLTAMKNPNATMNELLDLLRSKEFAVDHRILTAVIVLGFNFPKEFILSNMGGWAYADINAWIATNYSAQGYRPIWRNIFANYVLLQEKGIAPR